LTESGKDSTKLDELISSNKTKQPVRDQDYWQRRKINNKAANRSRAKKRKLIEEGQKSIQIYEEENPKLKLSLQNLKNELNELKMKLKTYQKSELST
jgi:predicted RNase H-like nuclease (RuvC/YqgF family)